MKRPHMLRFLHALGLFAACEPQDQGVTKLNSEPEARILSHIDGDGVLDGTPIDFRGTATDPDDGPEDLLTRWLLDGAEICPQTPANPDGTTTCTHALASTDRGLISLEVQDPDNASAFAQVALEVIPTGPPTAIIVEPQESVHYYSDRLISVVGQVDDPEASPASLLVDWELEDGTVLSVPGADSGGITSGEVLLPEGDIILRLRVTDPEGNAASDSVLVEVGPPNTPPTCDLAEPLDGAVLPLGEILWTRATLTDVDVGPELLRLQVESDLDGVLGDATPDSGGEAVVAASGLRAGLHQLTIRCQDEAGGETTVNRSVRVAQPPAVTILQPTAGEVFDAGVPITFEAQLSDAEDDPASLTVSWSSDIDGVFSTSPADSSGLALVNATLSVATHSISLSVTDSDGLTTTRLTALEVRPCAFYYDGDSDGYGDSSSVVVTCTRPAGYVALDGDCDDADIATYPGASEYCDGEDDDCNGLIDDGAALDAPEWFFDGDTDGFGDPLASVFACTAPSGYLALGGDCDDALDSAFPGAPEVCEDGIDQDCSGRDLPCILERELEDLSDTPLALYGESARDEAGAVLSGAGDLDGDGLPDLLVSAYLDDFRALDAGTAYVVAGTERGDVDLSSAQARILGGAREDYLGTAAAALGDLDGDGFDDIAIGAPNTDDGGADAGSVYLFFGPLSGDLDVADADIQLDGLQAGELLGSSLSATGDLDGDGASELLIGAWGWNDPTTSWADVGRTHLVSATSLLSGSLSSATATYQGYLADDRSGQTVQAAGDLDGDGITDFAIAAPTEDTGGNAAGAVYIVLGGGSTGAIELRRFADAKLTGQGDVHFAGRALSAGGDLDGDGRDDLAIGAVGEATGGTGAGAAYIWTTIPSGTRSLSLATTKITGEFGLDYFGRCVAILPDFDGDGSADLAIGASGDDATRVNGGALYLGLGPFTSGIFEAGSLSTRWLGGAADDGAGMACAHPGDVDANGYSDLIVGATGEDSRGNAAGAAYLLLGGSSW